MGQEGDNQESSKKTLPPPGLEGWGKGGVTRAQKPSHRTGSRTTMEAEQERQLQVVGGSCLAGSGLMDDTQLLRGTEPEVDREGTEKP